MKRTMILFAFAALALLCAWCHVAPPTSPKQLNITILLDLSDRIDTVSQDKKDIEAIKTIAEQFRIENSLSKVGQRGWYDIEGKIQVKAEPHDATIDSLLKPMRIDLKNTLVPKREAALAKMDSAYNDSCLNAIYQHAIETGRADKWPGSDIWRFFKENVDVCIEQDTNYRNILIILTDGYLYHAKTKDYKDPTKPNQYAYLLSKDKLNNVGKYCNDPDWENKIKRDDFGLITKRNDLQNLEILVLGIRTTGGQYTEEILKHVIGKWFDEMGVSKNKKKIVGADAVDIEGIIKNFLKP